MVKRKRVRAPAPGKARDAVPPAEPGPDTPGRPAAESVAGEEDPGSALELFSDLMHDVPPASDAADDGHGANKS